MAVSELGDQSLADEDAYGVPISREIEQRSRREAALGSVYAALERLEEKGLVRSRLGERTPERGGRAKRFFRATAHGIREAREAQQGWALDRTLEDGLTMAALRMALSRRIVEPGLVHHSDRGSQYASNDYTDLMARASWPRAVDRA